MVIQLSRPRNDVVEIIKVIILCAGEGTRIKEYPEVIPKPLIRVKSEDNRPILELILRDIFEQGIERAVIVTGHLRKKIEKFINSLKKNNVYSNKNLETLYSERYKLGPLFSLLKITEAESVFTKNALFMIVPGDTLFKLELLNEILMSIDNTLHKAPNPLTVFYREITVGALKQKHQQSTSISIAQINKLGSKKILNQIVQTELNEFSEEEIINQVIPVFLLNYDYIEKISRYQILYRIQTIREVMNYSITEGVVINAVQIQTEAEFYDIDHIPDLEYYEKLRKEEQ